MDKPNFRAYYGARSGFVYYNNLSKYRPEFYKRVVGDLIKQKSEHSQKMKSIAIQMQGWAEYEASKELALLKQYFNVDLDMPQLFDSNFAKQLTEALNISLQFKEVYERHMTRIIGKNGKQQAKITTAQFFASYFSTALAKIIQDKYNQIAGNIENMTLDQIADVLFSDENVEQALSVAFFESFKNSGDWNKNDENKGYQELFTAIEHFNKNEFLEEVKKAYKLDTLKERLIKELKDETELESKISGKNGKSLVKTSLKESTVAKGTLGEIMAKYVTSVAINEIQQAGVKVSFNAEVVGASRGKPDVVMTFDADISKVLDVINKHYKNRPERVDAVKSLNEYLRKLDKGFIVYTNVKDWSLVKNKGKGGYFFEGFSAGSPISLNNFKGVISNTPGGSAELIGQIINTLKGAVWSERKPELEQEICSKMAYLLFDDVTTIGKPTAASEHTIHLLYLDGIYVPLSLMFSLMSEAIIEVSINPEDLFKVTIQAGSISFPNPPWGYDKWVEQRSIAMDNIKISATFLKNFADVISSLR